MKACLKEGKDGRPFNGTSSPILRQCQRTTPEFAFLRQTRVRGRVQPCTSCTEMIQFKKRQSGEQSQPGKRWRSSVKAVGGFFLYGKALFCPHSRTHAPLKIQTACCRCLIFTCAVFLIRTTLGSEAVLVVGLL